MSGKQALELVPELARGAGQAQGRQSKVPEGKAVLNAHLSKAEALWIQAEARRWMITKTAVIRNLIRREMEKKP